MASSRRPASDEEEPPRAQGGATHLTEAPASASAARLPGVRKNVACVRGGGLSQGIRSRSNHRRGRRAHVLFLGLVHHRKASQSRGCAPRDPRRLQRQTSALPRREDSTHERLVPVRVFTFRPGPHAGGREQCRVRALVRRHRSRRQRSL